MTTWRDGNKVQSIAMPCNSVWAVASRANGDLLVACNDGMGRVFSRDPSRQAPDDVIASFIEHVAQVALARYHPPTCIHNAHKLVYSCLSTSPHQARVLIRGTRLCGPCCRAGEAEEKIGDLDTSNLVGVERLTSPGEADGQIIMVRDGSKVMAHSWSTAENAWQTIGEVCPRSLLQEMAQTCHISSCVLTVLKSPRAPRCLRAHFL